jgi:hypothetical protein
MMHPAERSCNGLFCSTDEAPAGGGIFLKSHGKPKAQREFEVKDRLRQRCDQVVAGKLRSFSPEGRRTG